MQPLICGIDGGQSSTKCIIATADGQTLGQGKGGPLLHLSAAGGRERFASAMAEALHSTWRSAGMDEQPLAALVVGASGVEAGTVEASTAQQMLASLVQAQHVEICNDAVIALYGAHAGQAGVIVIAGTGTIALGMDEQGEMASVGGWGWIIDDEGSAFGIGRAGLRAALRAVDGREPFTQLIAAFENFFAVASLPEIKRIVYRPDFGAAGYASLATVVSQAARSDDGVAQAIIAQAGELLAQQALAAIRRLHFQGKPIPVAAMGGAVDHIAELNAAFAGALAQSPLGAVPVKPQFSALLGAVLMGMKACGKQGADWDAALERLRQFGCES